MAITTNFGKLVVDTSLIPYIRYNDVEFTAHNLMPYTLAKLFFDDGFTVTIFTDTKLTGEGYIEGHKYHFENMA